MSKLFINSISRITTDGEVESLNFISGLNLIIGEPNTGKTVWLKLLDHAFGDGSSIENALGEDEELLKKYVGINLDLIIESSPYLIERFWNKPGVKSKTTLNGEALSPEDFSTKILNLLNLPAIKIPKGNPYLNNWVSLSFRSIFRHIYRQERFWSDLADKQPEADQFASLSLFLGFADQIFSQELNNVADKYKKVSLLQAQKEQFSTILDKITLNMTVDEEEGKINYATIDQIDKTILNFKSKLNSLLVKRNESLGNSVKNANNNGQNSVLQEISKERSRLLKRSEEVQEEISLEQARQTDIVDLKNKLIREIEKLQRSEISGLLSNIKVTHCPACDQEVQHSNLVNDDHCFLCHQSIDIVEGYEDRVKFEVRQLQIELSELDTLNRSSYERLKSLSLQLDSYSRLLRENNQKIQPYKNVLSIVTNEEIAIIDMERGKLNEKIENLIRIKDTVKEKNEISKRVDEITTEIKNIENIASTKMVAVNFSEIANDLEEAMNTYTSSLNTDSRNIWNQGRISCHLTAKGFNFYVGAKRWTALSATLKGYFLLAYHYALLRLSVMDKYNYPQLLILDFPVQFGKEEITSSSLNYLLEPFAELQELFPEKTQIIVAGRNFNIPNSSNEIYLRKVWE